MAAKKKSKTVKSKSKRTTWLIIIICIAMIIVFKAGFLFFIIGILPSIVSYYVDATKNNLSFQTVFTCNLAGILPYMVDMLQGKSIDAEVQAILSDSISWFVVYSAAAIGWMLVLTAPSLAQLIISTINKRQINRLEKQQKILRERWGDELEKYALSKS